MTSRMKIVVLYSLFAATALVANLGTQALFLRSYDGYYAIAASVVLGTAVGLPIKYILDKKYIFKFTANDLLHDSRVFILYVLMALVTTAIFWVTEALFQLWFQTEPMRLLGGAIGLIIGYLVKYQLDKKYVFSQSKES